MKGPDSTNNLSTSSSVAMDDILALSSPSGGENRKRSSDTSTSYTEADSTSVPSTSKKVKVGDDNILSHSQGEFQTELARKEEILTLLRSSKNFANFSDLELELLCVCAYLKPNMIPKQLLLNYSKDKSTEIKCALNTLEKKEIITAQDQLEILSISNVHQKDIRNLINSKNNSSNEEAVLERILQILIVEEKTRKEGGFPYSGYMQDIILIAIGIWELAFKYRTLVEKYVRSLEQIAIASHEEASSLGISVLFFSKILRHLSIMFGHNDAKTLSLKLCMSFISARNGKVERALEELDLYIKQIESSDNLNVKSLLCRALETKAIVLRNEKKFEDALKLCNKILDLNVTEFNINAHKLMHIKHLKCKILIDLGRHDEALAICNNILHDLLPNDTLIEDVKYYQAKAYRFLKQYREALMILNSVISKHRCDTIIQLRVLAARTERAETLEDMELYDKAIGEFNFVLKACTEKFGLHDIKTINTNASIARVLARKGNQTEASTIMNKVFDIAVHKFGSNSREVKDIVAYKEKILDISQNEQKPDVKTVNNCFSEFKKYYIEMFDLSPNASDYEIEKQSLANFNGKNYRQALSDFTNIHDKIEKDFGDDCPGLEQPLEIMREANQKLDLIEAELAVLKKLYRLRLILYGDKKSTTFNTLLKIADIQNTLNQKAAALVSYETLYKYIVNLRGLQNSRVYSILKKIAYLQVENYQYDDAITSFRNLQQIMQNRPAEALEELNVNYNIALCYMKLARIEEASLLCSKFMKDFKVIFGGKLPSNNKYQNLYNFVQNLFDRLQRTKNERGGK